MGGLINSCVDQTVNSEYHLNSIQPQIGTETLSEIIAFENKGGRVWSLWRLFTQCKISVVHRGRRKGKVIEAIVSRRRGHNPKEEIDSVVFLFFIHKEML